MKADPEDMMRPAPNRDGFPMLRVLVAMAVLAGILLLLFWGDKQEPEEVVSQPPPVEVPAPREEVAPAPDIPHRYEPVAQELPEAEEGAEPVVPVSAVLPTPEESDEIFIKQLGLVTSDEKLNSLVNKEHPLDTSAALIDGMSRGVILRKILPASSPGQAFSVTKEGGSIYMDTAGYERFDGYAKSIESLDSKLVVEAFHTLRPLYERTYEQLGLDAADFDNAVIRVLDLILATPEIEGPIELKSKSVAYIYADPELESLPSLQKQLIRMGPGNIRTIKRQAQAIRDGLLGR